MKTLITATAFFSFLILNIAAAADTPAVDERQQVQHQRITQGVKDGSLTRRERVRLGAQQHRIRHHERHAKADGVVTRGERARLHHHQNRASRNIQRQKHDDQERDN